jgi:hypothetical protein
LLILHDPPADLEVGSNVEGVDVPAGGPAGALNEVPYFFDKGEEGFSGRFFFSSVMSHWGSASLSFESGFLTIRSPVDGVKVMRRICTINPIIHPKD